MFKTIIPTIHQNDCVNYIVDDWFYNPDKEQECVIQGGSGSGKSTIIIVTMDRLKLRPYEILVVSFTGQAVSNLMEKGIRHAKTIHSSLKELVDVPRKDALGEIIKKNGRVVTKSVFRDIDIIDPRVKLIIVDEWSMLDDELRYTLTKHGIPVLLFGDKNQLPPITGTCPYLNMISYNLPGIVRQSEDNGILLLADMILNQEPLNWYMNFNNQAFVLPKSFLNDDHIMDADVILTATNKTRDLFNQYKRKLRGHTGKLPEMGDKIICRKNYRNKVINNFSLVNGTRGELVQPIIMSECNFNKGYYTIDFKPDFIKDKTVYHQELKCSYPYLNYPTGSADEMISKYDPYLRFQWAEAITAHLSQGMTCGTAMVWYESIGDREFMKKWVYTAITRAKERVFLFI